METKEVPVLRAVRSIKSAPDTDPVSEAKADSKAAVGSKRHISALLEAESGSEGSSKRARLGSKEAAGANSNMSVSAREQGAMESAETGGVKCEVVARHSVEMSEVETSIFRLLRDVLKVRGLRTVVRVAGGWVRDKLLGRENHDIDVAVDDMTGIEFAEHVQACMESQGLATRTIAKIEANPEQSKHLETATVKIFDMPIDFVNLRAEEYAQDSRIPEMRFGSASEDADRRDFTVNALFYNVNTGAIEDLTGRGYIDLRAGVIRTPLPPRTTLLDDPLRVMRAVRFASRYAFHLVPELKASMMDPVVRAALGNKVSRERVGSELDGMLLGQRPIGSLRMLHDSQLLATVFEPCCPLFVHAHEVTRAQDAVREAKRQQSVAKTGGKKGKGKGAKADEEKGEAASGAGDSAPAPVLGAGATAAASEEDRAVEGIPPSAVDAVLADPIMQAGLMLPGLQGVLWPAGASGSLAGVPPAVSGGGSGGGAGDSAPAAARSNSTGARFTSNLSPGGWPQQMYEQGSEVVDGLDVLLGVLGSAGPSVKDAHKVLSSTTVPPLCAAASVSSLLGADGAESPSASLPKEADAGSPKAPSSIAGAASGAGAGGGTLAAAGAPQKDIVPLHRRLASDGSTAADWEQQAAEAVKGADADQLHVEADFSPAGSQAASGAVAAHVPVLGGGAPLVGSLAELRVLLLAGILWPLRGLHTLAFDGKDKGKGAPATSMVIKYAVKRKLADANDAVALQECAAALREAARAVDGEVHRAGLHVEADAAAHVVEEEDEEEEKAADGSGKAARRTSTRTSAFHDRTADTSSPVFLARKQQTQRLLTEGSHRSMQRHVSHHDLARLLHEGEAGEWDAGVIAKAASQEAELLGGGAAEGVDAEALAAARLRTAVAIRACGRKWAQARLLALAADMRDLAAVSHQVRRFEAADEAESGGDASSGAGGSSSQDVAVPPASAEEEAALLLEEARERLGLAPLREEDRLAQAGHEERRTLLDHALKHVLRKHVRIWCLASLWRCDRAWEVRPLVNGKALGKLGAPRGKAMSHLMQAQLEWLLVRPGAKEEDCEAFLKEQIAAMAAGGSAGGGGGGAAASGGK